MGTMGDKDASASLIATLGSEPQVVTAALDLLLQQGERIQDVCVVHTASTAPPIDRAVKTLEQAFSTPQYRAKLGFQMVPIRTAEGSHIQDVVTPQENQAAFKCLYNLVRTRKHAGNKVHLCIAGGRKTMALYGMLSAQLLFDEHDRLWHLVSAGDFLASKRLHPKAGDQVQLTPIPVVRWSRIAPTLLDFAQIDDPQAALARQQALQLDERLAEMRAFVLGALSPAEQRVVAILVKDGLSDNELAGRLQLSPRTVEEHLRSAYRKAADHWGISGVGRTQLIALLNLYYSTQITGNPA